MELQEAIYTRRTLREFAPLPIDPAIIHKALTAGLKAPSYNHLKQWDFLLIKDPSVRVRLTQTESMSDTLTEETKKALADYEPLARKMYTEAIPRQKRMILEAPELLVVVFRPKTPADQCRRVYDMNCLASVWCCIENILLSLAEDQVFGVTFIPQNTPLVKEILAIPPELEVAAFIPLGYRPPHAVIMAQTEVALEDRLHIDRW